MPSDKDKPHVGARVSTKRRVIAGVEHSDTGMIIHLEDGGYCVVRWDSDGESTSVLMMSLRPLADNDYSEGFDDAASIARVFNSVTTMPTSETTITVEQALAELREMFPNESYGSIEGTFFDEIGMRVRIGLRDINRHWNAPTLDQSMAQVRAWKESHD